jgi:predicted Ser/Thr protein kinase
VGNRQSIDILADRVDRLACSKCGHLLDLSGAVPFSEVECPVCHTKQNAPLQLGAFLLLRELGKGGMGSVYRAYDQTLGRLVAIKVMQRELAEDPRFAENFVREARAAAALNHAHVVQIYSCAQEKGQLYIVMELVDGGRLDEMMAGGKQLDEAFVLRVGLQVAEGLHAAHEIGLIHGDIKPGNILFDKQERAKVVDFGLARFAAQQHMQPGEIWGTPYYIAPEKVRSRQEDARADLYSLGATLYHALAGVPPFEGETAKDVVVARLKQPAPDILSVRPTLSVETAAALTRSLEADPSKRYPTYKSLIADLRQALAAVEAKGQAKKAVRPTATARSPWGWLAPLMGVGVAAMVGLLFWFSRQPDPTERPASLPPYLQPSGGARAASELEGVEEGGEEQPVARYPVQPFGVVQQEWIQQAAAAWREGRQGSYRTLLNELEMGEGDQVAPVWRSVLLVLPDAVSGASADEMAAALNWADRDEATPLESGESNPQNMPLMTARLLRGALSLSDVQARAESWPRWFQDWVLFVGGARQRQDMAEAAALLDAYVAATPESDDVQWPYAYQAMAADWLSDWAEWEAVDKEDLAALEAFQSAAPEWLAARVGDRVDRLRQAEAERQAAERSAAAAALAAREHEELDRVEALRVSWRQSLLPQRAFREARYAGRDLEAELETTAGQAALAALEDGYARLHDLRNLIVEASREDGLVPRQAIGGLRGDFVAASPSGIREEIGGRGTITRPWIEVDAPLFGRLSMYYIERLPEPEQARHWLALAFFAAESGIDAYPQFIERALGLDAGLGETVDLLFPDRSAAAAAAP